MPDLMRLFDTAEPPELGPGPRPGVHPKTQVEADLEQCLPKAALSAERRQLIRALVLLWHDHLEPAHRLAQDIAGPDGAFVHGIMHRREPDYANAAYWFRRVGEHAVFTELARRAVTGGNDPASDPVLGRIVPRRKWDPFVFIEACQHACESGDSSEQRLLRRLQQIESEALLDYLLESAGPKSSP